MAEIRKLHEEFGREHQRAVTFYLEAMNRERPNNARMKAFREGVLLPLGSWSLMTRSRDGGIDSETWSRLRVSVRRNHHRESIFKATGGLVARQHEVRNRPRRDRWRRPTVWDANTGKELFSLQPHGPSVGSFEWSPDGRQIATGGLDETPRVWDAAAGGLLVSLPGHEGWGSPVRWSRDGKRLATCDKKGTARIWDAVTGKMLFLLVEQAETVRDVEWSADGKRLVASASDDHPKVTVWDALTGEQRYLLGTGRKSCRPTVHGSPQRRELRTAFPREGGTPRPASCNSPFPDRLSIPGRPTGDSSAARSDDGMVYIRDADTGKEKRLLIGFTVHMAKPAWSPDGKRIACLANFGDGKTPKVWNGETGEELCSLTGHTDGVRALKWSPNSRYLATASSDKTARVWDAETGKELFAHRTHKLCH